MGIAAYNRGSAAISQQIDAEARPVEFELMERLNAEPKYLDAGTPFGPTRLVPGHGGFWHQDRAKGDSGFGYWYPTLYEAVRRWRVTIVAYEHGAWMADPMPRIHALFARSPKPGTPLTRGSPTPKRTPSRGDA